MRPRPEREAGPRPMPNDLASRPHEPRGLNIPGEYEVIQSFHVAETVARTDIKAALWVRIGGQTPVHARLLQKTDGVYCASSIRFVSVTKRMGVDRQCYLVGGDI